MAEQRMSYFFHPWIGNKYNEGLLNNKKVLVVGASHYCTHSDKCIHGNNNECAAFSDGTCANGCMHHSSCTNGATKDYNDCCKYMKEDCHTSQYYDICTSCNPSINGKLNSTTIDEVCNFLYAENTINRTYKRFTNYCSHYIKNTNKEEMSDKDIWEHLSFVNFAQNFQPYSHGNTFVEDDYCAFLQYIYNLAPDVVIVWGDVGNHLYSIGFKKDAEHEHYIWKKIMKTKSGVREIVFLHSFHPAYGGYEDGGKLDRAMNQVFCSK